MLNIKIRKIPIIEYMNSKNAIFFSAFLNVIKYYKMIPPIAKKYIIPTKYQNLLNSCTSIVDYFV